MLAAAGLKTVVGRAARMVIEGGRLVGIELTDASTVPCDAVALKPRVTVRSTLLDSLGVAREQDEYGSRVTVESDGATSVPGVWAAGNVTNGALQVMAASVAGANAASAINADLTNADLRRKLQRMAGVAPAPPRAH
jgi:thioredoxin reductase